MRQTEEQQNAVQAKESHDMDTSTTIGNPELPSSSHWGETNPSARRKRFISVDRWMGAVSSHLHLAGRPNPALDNHEWRRQAACRGKTTEWFFPDTEQDGYRALGICVECPVRVSCAHYGLHYELDGVFGGMTRRHRIRWRKRLNIKLSPPESKVQIRPTSK